MKICFLDRSTKLDTAFDLEIKPRGGMVNSLFKVSDYLSGRGHDVWVLSDIKTPGVTKSGVKWVNQYSLQEFDFLITNRGTGSGYADINARHRVLWTHDLPHSGFIPEPNTIKAFSATVFMSRYSERQWRTFYKTIGKSFLIPNGVDDSFYPREKDLDYIIYFSHPNRGLKRLPFILDCIQSQLGRQLKCHAYSSKAMYPQEGDSPGEIWELDYTDIPTTFHHKDPIPTYELAGEVGKAGLCIMPTNVPETCSNSILQALKSGTPVITTGNLGSAGEWVNHRKNGMLTHYTPSDYMVYQVEMIRNAVEVLGDDKLHRRLMKRAAKTKIDSWDQVGQKWERMLKRLR